MWSILVGVALRNTREIVLILVGVLACPGIVQVTNRDAGNDCDSYRRRIRRRPDPRAGRADGFTEPIVVKKWRLHDLLSIGHCRTFAR